MPEPQIPTRGSRALARILRENGPIAKRLKARFDNSVLWRWATGRRGPDRDPAAAIEHLTRRKIPVRAWTPKETWDDLVRG